MYLSLSLNLYLYLSLFFCWSWSCFLMIPFCFARLGFGLEGRKALNPEQWICNTVSDQGRPRAAREAKNLHHKSIHQQTKVVESNLTPMFDNSYLFFPDKSEKVVAIFQFSCFYISVNSLWTMNIHSRSKLNLAAQNFIFKSFCAELFFSAHDSAGKKNATPSICRGEVSRQSLPCVLKTSLWQFSNTLPAIRLGDKLSLTTQTWILVRLVFLFLWNL